MGETLSPREEETAKNLYAKHKKATEITEDQIGIQPTFRERKKVYKQYEKGVKKDAKVLEQAAQHYKANEKEYKQQAVNEAQAAGVEVNYPPYTNQQSTGAELSTAEDIKAEALRQKSLKAEKNLAAHYKNMEDIAETRLEYGVAPDQKVINAHLKAGQNAHKEYTKAYEESVKHFRANEEQYKQQAVNEAREAGVDVNYPPYTEPHTPDNDPNQPK